MGEPLGDLQVWREDVSRLQGHHQQQQGMHSGMPNVGGNVNKHADGHGDFPYRSPISPQCVCCVTPIMYTCTFTLQWEEHQLACPGAMKPCPLAAYGCPEKELVSSL